MKGGFVASRKKDLGSERGGERETGRRRRDARGRPRVARSSNHLLGVSGGTSYGLKRGMEVENCSGHLTWGGDNGASREVR